MAYTNPPTRSTGNNITAAIWNSDLANNFKWFAHEATGGAPACRAFNSTNFSVADNTLTAITLNSERYDIGGCHSTVSNTSRLTVPSGGGGIYSIGGSATFDANATGVRLLLIRLNGTTDIGANGVSSASAGGSQQINVSSDFRLAAGDHVELVAFQSSGGNLDVLQAGAYSPEFWFRWVGV